MSPTWQPQPALLSEVVALLQAHGVPNNQVQLDSYQRLQQLEQNLEFNLYLVHLLCAAEVDVTVRELAGLLLKRNIKSRDTTAALSGPESEMLAVIRAQTLRVLANPLPPIRKTAGIIVTTFVSHCTFLDEWPELMPALSLFLEQQSDDNAIAGALSALVKICEDSAAKLEHSPSRPLNTLVPQLLHYFHHPNAIFRRDALACLNHVLIFMPVGLVVHMETFLAGISLLTQDVSSDVRKLVCKSIVILLEVGVQYLVPHLDSIIQFILRANQDKDETVAIEACEFWASFCDLREFEELKSRLQPYLTQVVPLLFRCMVYSEEDLANFEAEEQSQDENVPDRPEDIKPVFHRKAGSGHVSGGSLDEDDKQVGDEDSDDDDDGDDDDTILNWDLRRCSAAGLDSLANGYGIDILPTLLPLLQERLAQEQPWPLVESGILALGAIADGCYNGITPHLPRLYPFLLQKLEDPAPLIRSITCWTLSRYATWVVEQSNHEVLLKPLVEGMLKRILDPHKKVQEAACSAFCTLEEEAREELVPYLTPILQNLMFAFGKYQAKNLLILYDAIGTLADSIGEHLNHPELITILMPPLVAKWNALDDRSREILPLFECLAPVAQALGNGFQEFAINVYVRCQRIVENELLADAMSEQSPDEFDEGDPELIVCALDLISGMIEGLQHSSEALLNGSNILNVLMSCVRHEVLDVRQSAMGVVGDLAKYASNTLRPSLGGLLPVLIENLNPDLQTVCNNASWSVGEIAIRIGAEMEPYVESCLSRLIDMINRPKLPRNLVENCAITIGRLGYVCPNVVAPHLQEFAMRWCRALAHVRAPEEKEHCFLGLCYMVKANPNGIVADFMFMCGAIASLEGQQIQHVELKDMLYQIVHGFKTSLGDNWAPYFASFPEPLRQFLSMRFNL
uniref:Importin N-terminal domain-containing protein n=1 Tax=Hyaloperonospora arabidopsidis (strain Emoy2) TaxID=559515 RepID=M4BCU6_HYAAE